MDPSGCIVEEDQLSVQAGVPRREQCLVCAKPIFLAERMRVGDRFYHRRCLKCARCATQLTLGSFYETEVDGQFCCETCPDEELRQSDSEDDDDEEERKAVAAAEEKRISSLISNRLAMFERKTDDQRRGSGDSVRPHWRTSSLSDEQKSKSMRKFLQSGEDMESGDSSPPPPLPSEGPPEVPEKLEKNEEEVVLRSPGNVPEVRESQSVSNIREMFEKPRQSESEEKSKGVPQVVVEEKPTPPRVDSLSTFYSPETKEEREKKSNEEEQEILQDNPMDFKTPRKPSVEDWRDVKGTETRTTTAAEEETITDSDDVFLTPRPPAQATGAHNRGHDEEVGNVTLELAQDIKVKEDVIAVPEEEVKTETKVNDKVEESATKESDQVKEEISLELNTSTRGDQEKIEAETSTVEEEKYPLDLNPFGSDGEEEEEENQSMNKSATSGKSYNPSLNPFGEDEEEEEQIKVLYRQPEKKRVSMNPFGSEEEEEEAPIQQRKKVTPVPTPRRTVVSQRPEPSPRFQLRVPTRDSYYGSVSSLSKSSDFRGSTNSLSSSCSSANTSGTYQRTLKKRRAPLPPSMREATSAEYLTPPRKSSDASLVSEKSTEQKSTANSPRTLRKKRPAPKPPGPLESAPVKPEELPQNPFPSENLQSPPIVTTNEQLHSTPLKVAQGGNEETLNFTTADEKMSEIHESSEISVQVPESSGRRVIPLDDHLLEDQREEMSLITGGGENEDDSVFYRRVIVPLDEDESPLKETQRSSSRQWDKLKQNKESENRNRQSLVSTSSDGNGEMDKFYNKSQHGKWKRRKGPAPALPVPPKRVLQMLPIHDIRHELEVIEVQQQGLEKQGVQLEKMIREKTEGPEGAPAVDLDVSSLSARNTKEVEDLIMQLFDLVVEKNELFRRQAELMYLRRQHRLEAEQVELEYEIRVLMAQPECNKTDSDKAKEETMIARLMEVVKQRNEVVDCLEMDRLREAQEDLGIKQEIEKHTAKWDEELIQKPVKLSKKEKKTLKEEKKKLKNKKLDVDKDYDETEVPSDKSLSTSGTLEKEKKKKKKFLIL